MQGRSARGTTRLGENSPTHWSLTRKTLKLQDRNSWFHYDWLAPTASSLIQGMKTLLQPLQRLKKDIVKIFTKNYMNYSTR